VIGSFGSEPGQFDTPVGVSIDPITGHLYVVEDLGNRIQKITTTGVPIAVWGGSGTGDGQFQSPYDLAASQGLVW